MYSVLLWIALMFNNILIVQLTKRLSKNTFSRQKTTSTVLEAVKIT